MTEATCRRELDLEIPAEDVQKALERVAREFARVARVPGFRPGKAPVTLIRRRFAEDIKGEVLQSLVPSRIEQAVNEQKLVPVTRPQVDKVEFPESGPLKFRATFEVLPEFELGDYKNLEIDVEPLEVSDADIERALVEMRERAATFVPVEGRPIENDDFAQLKLVGTPVGGGEPLQADNVLCHIGAEDTLGAFNENLRGAQAGEHRRFEVHYPEDYPDPKLAGKAYNYAVEVVAIKQKSLPDLNDEFAKDVSDVATLAELRSKIRENLEGARDQRQADQARQRILAKLISAREFPVPEALVEHQMDVRLERAVRSLAAQGVDPRAVNVDWVALRRRQRDRAVEDVKAELILDRIASAENFDVDEQELEREIVALAERSGESATAVRARLTKQGALDRMKSKLRSDKTLEWLYRNARVRATAEAKK
ncbi:MAG TPA: trigger factor [Candidatus Acidoferrales bacterium]|jgi:trigger factor|nr:trigger factor [Candidatus Acidoferrales bacterium]